MEFFLLIIFGIIQGILEWIPVSSEGQSVLFLTQLMELNYETALSVALFLHIGTMLVAIVYFRVDIWEYSKSLQIIISKVKYEDEIYRDNFHGVLLIITATIGTAITAIISLVLLEEILLSLTNSINFSMTELLMLFIGIFLIITGTILHKKENLESTQIKRNFHSLSLKEAFFLGLFQGFAAIPGISRSGMTLSYLLFSGLSAKEAFKGSFLISIPAVAGSTFLLLLKADLKLVNSSIIIGSVSITFIEMLIVILATFITGLLTIKQLLKSVEKFPFDKVCIVLGIGTASIALLGMIISVGVTF